MLEYHLAEYANLTLHSSAAFGAAKLKAARTQLVEA